jgi:hypothetical protein
MVAAAHTQRMNMKYWAVVVALATVGSMFLACGKKTDGSKAKTADRLTARKVVDRTPLPFPTVDAKVELAALQGTWKVSDPALTFSAPATWIFAGNRLTRKGAGKSLSCTVTFPTPGRLVCVALDPSGLRKLASFAYARSGKKVYLSGGEAGVKIEGRWLVTLHDGILSLGDGKCVFYKFGLSHKQVEKPNPGCTYKTLEVGGKTVLAYEIPDPVRKGATKKGQLSVDGTAVVGKSVGQALRAK